MQKVVGSNPIIRSRESSTFSSKKWISHGERLGSISDPPEGDAGFSPASSSIKRPGNRASSAIRPAHGLRRRPVLPHTAARS
jgi:hypothetical protein